MASDMPEEKQGSYDQKSTNPAKHVQKITKTLVKSFILNGSKKFVQEHQKL